MADNQKWCIGRDKQTTLTFCKYCTLYRDPKHHPPTHQHNQHTPSLPASLLLSLHSNNSKELRQRARHDHASTSSKQNCSLTRTIGRGNIASCLTPSPTSSSQVSFVPLLLCGSQVGSFVARTIHSLAGSGSLSFGWS